MSGSRPPNNAIQLTGCVVTPRACARVAPTQPATDRVRYADRDQTGTHRGHGGAPRKRRKSRMTASHPPMPTIHPVFLEIRRNICDAGGFSGSTVVVSAMVNAEMQTRTNASKLSQVYTSVWFASTTVTGSGSQLRRIPLFSNSKQASVTGSGSRLTTRPSRDSFHAMPRDLSQTSSGDSLTAGPHNNPIKPPVVPVTRLACARRAPVPPAAYRVRYADMKQR